MMIVPGEDHLPLHKACHYVMHHLGLKFPDGSHPMTPGRFYTHLISTAIYADPINLQKIREGFPTVVDAIQMWRSHPEFQLPFLTQELEQTAATGETP